MQETVREVGRVAETEGIDCGFRPGRHRRPRPHRRHSSQRTHAEIAEARARGVGEDDLRAPLPRRGPARVGATDVLGGTYTPHCAAVDPARLVRGLAEVVERRGVAIYEQTEVRAIAPGTVTTDRGHGPGRHRGPGHRGLHPRALPATSGPSFRSTR